jgi:WD40 repeat protein
VTAAVFAPNGKTLATADHDGSLRLWDVATGRQLVVLLGHKGPLASLAYSPDGRMLASWCHWRKEYRQPMGKKGIVTTVVYGNEVKVWEAATGKERLTFQPEEARIGWIQTACPLLFAGNGSNLLTLRADGTVRHWDLAGLAVNPK